MTMPHLMNCHHSPEGWCLECVRKLYEGFAGLRDGVLQIEQVAHNPADLAPDLHPTQAGMTEEESLWSLVCRLGSMANRLYIDSGDVVGDDPNSSLRYDLWRHKSFLEKVRNDIVKFLEDH